MKVTPAAPASAPAADTSAQDSRSRAINAFKQAPVPQNQNAVSIEETVQTAQKGQNDTIEVDETVASPGTEDTPQPAPVKEPSVSSQFAALARREKAIRAQAQQQEQASKARELAFTAKEAELQAKLASYEQSYVSKDRLKADLLGTLTEQGLSYDDITQQFLNNQSPLDPRVQSHIQKLEAKLAALEAKATQGEEQAKSSQAEQYQAAIKQITNDTRQLISTDPEFEMVKATGSVKDVVELIERTFNEKGTLLTVEDAARQVEEYLTDEALKLSRTGKIQKRLQPVAPTAAALAQKTPSTQTQPQPVKTLTNSISSSRQLSAKERAILAFKGELGKG